MFTRLTCNNAYSKPTVLLCSIRADQLPGVRGQKRLCIYRVLHCLLYKMEHGGAAIWLQAVPTETCPQGPIHVIRVEREMKIQDKSRKRGGKPGRTLACSPPVLPAPRHHSSVPAQPAEDRNKSQARLCTAPWPPTMASAPCFSPGGDPVPRSPTATPRAPRGCPGWKSTTGSRGREPRCCATVHRTAASAGKTAGSPGPSAKVQKSGVTGGGHAQQRETPRQAAASFPAAPLGARAGAWQRQEERTCTGCPGDPSTGSALSVAVPHSMLRLPGHCRVGSRPRHTVLA